MSRRRSRTIAKAAGFTNGNSPAVTGTTWTADQVAAVLRATVASAGGQAAMPLPRLEPMVPFGPGIPLVPAPINTVRPDSHRAEPRAFEYPVAWNLPSFGERLVPWKVLRDAADMIPLFRRCIEIRKAEVATLDWDVVISAKAIERAQRQDPSSARSDIEKQMRERVDPHIGRLVDFWEQPDPRNGHDFIAWAGKLLEEYFVLDAIAVYPRMRRNGDLFGFEILDGTTIKPLLDADGFRPLPPQPAFQQILYGFPRGEFTADGEPDPDSWLLPGAYPSDRLVYKVHNTRSWTPYGYGAVEQALYDGELYLRRMGWLKSEYTDGVMPAGWLLSGEGQAEWSPQMLAEYERQFNDYLAGSTVARQRFRILPYGMKPDDTRTDLGERYRADYDLHLIKLVASHFDTTIAELGFTETGGLGSTGWHEGQADVQDRKATQPTLRRLQSLCTRMMRTYLNAPPELEFRILGLESEDEDAADEVANRRISTARMTLNEDRDRTGLPRYAFPEADMPMLITQRGIVFMEGASELAEAGQMVSPATGVPIGAPPPGGEVAPDGTPAPPGAEPSPPGGAPKAGAKPAGKPSPDAVKAELAAYRRWLAKGTTGRPFRFATITKADAAAAGVELDKAEFGGDPGTAPKVRHWPGWERDLAVAERWAPRLLSASTGLRSARTLVADASRAYARGGAREVARGLSRLDYAEAFRPALRGMWTDGYLIGAVSSRLVLAHHGVIVKAEAGYASQVTMATDWEHWTPGDELAARQILEREGFLTGLQDMLDTGDTIADKIAVQRLDRLAATLIAGLKAGDAPDKIGIAIRAINADPKWAYRVAVTETTRAVSSATLLRYARNGVDAKEWMSAGDQRVCSPCNVNEDTGAIPLADMFPDGNDAPPGHPLCRCSIGPAWLTADEAAAAGASPLDLLGAPEFGAEDLGAAAVRDVEEILAEDTAVDELAAEAAAETPAAVEPAPLTNAERRAAARARQATIAGRQAVGDLLAELDELLAKGASNAVLAQRLDLAAQLGAVDDATIEALETAERSGLRAEMGRIAADNGLTLVGRAGEAMPYDETVHEAVGTLPGSGAPVQILRPGVVLNLDGEIIPLSRAQTVLAETPARASYAARQDAVRRLGEQKPVQIRQMGGNLAHTNLLSLDEFDTGPKLIEKIYDRSGETAAELKHEVDAEQLGAKVLDALGLRSPAVVATGRDRLLIEYIDGEVGAEIGYGSADGIIESDQGRLLGLADVLMANADRNMGNWLLSDSRLAGIDHGEAFHNQLVRSEFTAHLTESGTVFGQADWRETIDFSREDLALVRERLAALRPDFVALKRTSWFNQMMGRLREVEKRAIGSRNMVPR